MIFYFFILTKFKKNIYATRFKFVLIKLIKFQICHSIKNFIVYYILYLNILNFKFIVFTITFLIQIEEINTHITSITTSYLFMVSRSYKCYIQNDNFLILTPSILIYYNFCHSKLKINIINDCIFYIKIQIEYLFLIHYYPD